jgi:spore germination protein YaaH
MRRDKREAANKKGKIIKIIVLIVVIILMALLVWFKAPDYYVKEVKGKTNLVINNNNVTSKMKDDVYIDNKGVIYLSINDVKNYFDKYINYDENSNRLITTSDTKTATLIKDKKNIDINGATVSIASTVIEKDGKIYIPFSELAQNVYNVEIEHKESTDRVVIDSLDRELKKADSKKNVKVKYKAKKFSKTLAKVKQGEKIVVISQDEKWSKIRTENGIVGYVKNKTIANLTYVRENMEETKQINGKVNLVWDYYSEYAKAPNRSEENIEGVNVLSPSFFYLEKGSDGKVSENVKQEGKDYIEWAHNNGFKVWPIVSNNSYLTTTEGILNDYTKRRKLEDEIIRVTEEYNIDGINLDFENMNQEDKDMYSRFVIELAPRLKDLGKTLTVDVTAPDGSETWSLCFDRDVLANVSDYIVFMAYDQYGTGGNKEGTTAGYNWVENNVNKFIGQEAVAKEKIILGIPLYTRLWKEDGGKITSKVVNIKDVESTLPSDIQKKWDEELKQNYVEYTDGSATYKMWIEDEKSITEKIGLAKKYDLAGIAFWEKDREYDGFWQFVANEYK